MWLRGCQPYDGSWFGEACFLYQAQASSPPTMPSKCRENVMRTLRNIRNVVGIAGLLLGGYIFVRSIPDVARYIRISTM